MLIKCYQCGGEILGPVVNSVCDSTKVFVKNKVHEDFAITSFTGIIEQLYVFLSRIKAYQKEKFITSSSVSCTTSIIRSIRNTDSNKNGEGTRGQVSSISRNIIDIIERRKILLY